jgi:hypothetical protein
VRTRAMSRSPEPPRLRRANRAGPRWRAITATAVLLAGLATAQGPTPVTLRVGPPLGAISPDAITGFNFGLSMPVALHPDEFGALDLRSLRFPPGNDADDKPLSDDMAHALTTPWRLLEEPDLHVVLNFFEGPEHAVEVVRRFDELGLRVRWWAVGNEPDLYPRNRMDPSWTAEVYCERFREVRAAVRALVPDAVMTGPAVSGSRPSGLAYLREVLGRCGDVIDVLTWHVYPTDGTWDDDAALATARSVGAEIRELRGWLTDPEINPLGYQRDVGLAITEFGLSWRTSMYRHLEDQTAALWLADALGQMATLDLDLGQYFALQSMGGHGLIDRGGWVRPTYHVYAMLAGFGGIALAVEGADDRLGAYAAEDGTALRILLVNRSSDDLEVALDAADLPATLAVATLDEAGFDLALDHARAERPASLPVPVPARSVVVIHAER